MLKRTSGERKRQCMFRCGSHPRKYFLLIYILTVFHNLCSIVKVLLIIQLIITPAKWERKRREAGNWGLERSTLTSYTTAEIDELGCL